MPPPSYDIFAFVYQQLTAANGSGLNAEPAEALRKAIVHVMQLHDGDGASCPTCHVPKPCLTMRELAQPFGNMDGFSAGWRIARGERSGRRHRSAFPFGSA